MRKKILIIGFLCLITILAGCGKDKNVIKSKMELEQMEKEKLKDGFEEKQYGIIFNGNDLGKTTILVNDKNEFYISIMKTLKVLNYENLLEENNTLFKYDVLEDNYKIKREDKFIKKNDKKTESDFVWYRADIYVPIKFLGDTCNLKHSINEDRVQVIMNTKVLVRFDNEEDANKNLIKKDESFKLD